MKHEDAQVPPADAGRLETPVRPQHTEWEEIRMALRQEYGHPYSYRGQPLVDFSRHVYVGRACALLLMAEKQERALREAIATLERDGDEWGVCDRLRAALRPNVGANVTATAPLTTPKRKGVPAVAGHVERRVRRPAIRDFSEQELHAELARRRALREDKTPKRWCDECEHFKPSDDPKLTKNPCSKSHAMHFIMPESPGDYEWGFYRRQCADWTPNLI